MSSEFYYVLAFFDSDWVELIGVVFLGYDTLATFSVIKLAICFSQVAFVFPWDRRFIIFVIMFKIIFGLVLEFISEVKILQENFLASLMVHQFSALCWLYLFRFSDERFVLNFLRVAWGSLMFFVGYGNEDVGKMYYGFFLVCICFWDWCGKA